MGPTVNLASRLESIAAKDQIIISSKVKDLTSDEYMTSSIPISSDKPVQSFPEVNMIYEIGNAKS
jgi:class 3 adenylate cyclase